MLAKSGVQGPGDLEDLKTRALGKRIAYCGDAVWIDRRGVSLQTPLADWKRKAEACFALPAAESRQLSPRLDIVRAAMKALVRKVRSALSFHYLEDGMGTSHVADFLHDSEFNKAYRLGVATGSWHGCDLRWRVYNACWAARQVQSLPGDFVECGVNRGGISRSVVDYVNFGKLDKRFYLLDTYEGWSAVADDNKNDYQECYASVLDTFGPFPNVKVIRGRVPDTLPKVDSEHICYLSIDMNNHIPEIAALRFFWPKLVPGAVVILDDYAYSESYRPSHNAMDALGEELGFVVLTMPTGQGMVIKK
jgi:O-methyltransferase